MQNYVAFNAACYSLNKNYDEFRHCAHQKQNNIHTRSFSHFRTIMLQYYFPLDKCRPATSCSILNVVIWTLIIQIVAQKFNFSGSRAHAKCFFCLALTTQYTYSTTELSNPPLARTDFKPVFLFVI